MRTETPLQPMVRQAVLQLTHVDGEIVMEISLSCCNLCVQLHIMKTTTAGNPCCSQSESKGES